MTTPSAAHDAICQALRDAWVANAVPLGAAADAVDWPNVKRSPDQPHLYDGNTPWARLTVMHDGGDQKSMGPVGGRRFTRSGRVVVQVFVPVGKQGLEAARQLGTVALNAYEGVSLGGVTYYRAVLRDVGIDGNWYQTNVEADFEYDVVK